MPVRRVAAATGTATLLLLSTGAAWAAPKPTPSPGCTTQPGSTVYLCKPPAVSFTGGSGGVQSTPSSLPNTGLRAGVAATGLVVVGAGLVLLRRRRA